MATHGRAAVLPHSLPAILRDPALHELVVVIDGSRDGSAEYVEELRRGDERIKVLSTAGEGAPAARQRGIQAASAEVILLLDDDVVAGPDLAAGHARHHQGRSNLVVLGFMPVRRPSHRRRGDAAVLLYAEEYDRMCERYERESACILEDFWLGNVSLRRDDALRVPNHSDDFGSLYHEDRDFGLRLQAAGLHAVFDRNLAAVHLYERPVAAFVRGAHSQGKGTVALHALHPEVLGPLNFERFRVGLPRPAAAVVGLARRPRADRLLDSMVMGAAVGAGRLGLWPVETAALRLLRRMAQQRGATAALRESPGRSRAAPAQR